MKNRKKLYFTFPYGCQMTDMGNAIAPKGWWIADVPWHQNRRGWILTDALMEKTLHRRFAPWST